MYRKTTISLFALFLFLTAQILWAITLTLSPVKDTMLVDSTTERGNDERIIVGPYTSLLKFDLASLPADAEVTSVSLKVYHQYLSGDSSTEGSVGLWVMQKAWNLDEDNTLDIGEPTSNRQVYNTISWSADFARGIPDRGDVISVDSITSASEWGQWSIPAEIIEGWRDNPATNYGVQIDGYGNDYRKTFRSKEHVHISERPVLTVDYTIPAPVYNRFDPVMDTMLVNDTTEYGNDDRLITGTPATGPYTLLLKFDLTSLPTGITITGATLNAYHPEYADNPPGEVQVGLWVMQKSWTQDEDGILEIGECCKTYKQYNTVSWTAPFARGMSDRGSLISTDSISYGAEWGQWSIPGSVIESWRDNPATNYGVQLDSIDGISRRTFYSKEYSSADPIL